MLAKNKNTNDSVEFYLVDSDPENHVNTNILGKYIQPNVYSPTLYSWGTIRFEKDGERLVRDGFPIDKGQYILRDSRGVCFCYPQSDFEKDYEVLSS